MKKIRIHRNGRAYIWLLLYRFSLEYIYVNFLSKIWSYSGFENSSSLEWKLFSWLVFFGGFSLFRIFTKGENPSSLLFTILYVINFIPGTIMLAYQSTEVRFAMLYIAYWMIMGVAYNIIKPIKFKQPSQKTCYFVTEIISWLFTLTVVFVWAYYAHFRITINVLDVYGIRSESSQYSMPVILSYALAASRAIIPCLCVYRLARREYVRFLVLFAVQIINFSIDGLKSALFAIVIAVVCFFFYNKDFKYNISKWLLCLNIVGVIEYLVIGSYTIISVFIRRVVFVPSLYNYSYYKFFSNNPYDYFKQGFLKYFGFVSEYSQRIPYIIGNYMGHSGEYSNNGLFSDAYSNLGIVGIIIMPFFVVAVVKIFDGCSKGLDIRLVIGAVIANSMTLIGSNLTVFALTQGFIFTCIVVSFMPRDIHYMEKNQTMLMKE